MHAMMLQLRNKINCNANICELGFLLYVGLKDAEAAVPKIALLCGPGIV